MTGGLTDKGEYRLLVQGAGDLAHSSRIIHAYRWGSARLVPRDAIWGSSPALKTTLPVYSLCESYGIYNFALGPCQSGRVLKRRSREHTHQERLSREDEIYVGGIRLDRGAVRRYLQLLFDKERTPLVLVLAKTDANGRINVSGIDRPPSLTLGDAIQLWPDLMTPDRRSALIEFDG